MYRVWYIEPSLLEDHTSSVLTRHNVGLIRWGALIAEMPCHIGFRTRCSPSPIIVYVTTKIALQGTLFRISECLLRTISTLCTTRNADLSNTPAPRCTCICACIHFDIYSTIYRSVTTLIRFITFLGPGLLQVWFLRSSICNCGYRTIYVVSVTILPLGMIRSIFASLFLTIYNLQ